MEILINLFFFFNIIEDPHIFLVINVLQNGIGIKNILPIDMVHVVIKKMVL